MTDKEGTIDKRLWSFFLTFTGDIFYYYNYCFFFFCCDVRSMEAESYGITFLPLHSLHVGGRVEVCDVCV